jgi:type III restriction enzyme
VNEIKEDKDDSKENKAKYKFAKLHFEILNQKLKEMGVEETYIFHMLSPQAYTTYFDYLKNGTLFQSQDVFKCELECLLESPT